MKEDLEVQGNSLKAVNTSNFINDFRGKSNLLDDIELFQDAIETLQNLRYRYLDTLCWYSLLLPDPENEDVKKIIETCNKKIADYDRLIELMQEYEIQRRSEQ